MRKNKKILPFLALLPLLLILISWNNNTKTKAIQKTNRSEILKEKFQPNIDSSKAVFWYRITVRIDRKTSSYKIGGTNRIMAGTKQEFDHEVWKGLARRVIMVGPFKYQMEAANSRMLYKSSREKIDEIPSASNPPTVYWFPIDFREATRLKIFILERTPSQVGSGNTLQFTDGLYQQLTFMKLAIGPFWNYEQAEMGKSIYSRNE